MAHSTCLRRALEARFWGGVHWRKDHEFGKMIGQAVADELIQQLNRSLVSPNPSIYRDRNGALIIPSESDLEHELNDILTRRRPDVDLWNWKDDGPYPDITNCGEEAVALAEGATLQGGRVGGSGAASRQ